MVFRKMASSTYLHSDVKIVPPVEHLVCEEYKHSALVQP